MLKTTRYSGLQRAGEHYEREVERRANVAQMMADNREGLGMKVIAVMVQRYGVLPKELWDLNKISDMGAGRGITYDDARLPDLTYKRIIDNKRYRIINLSIDKHVTRRVDLPSTLRRLKIMVEEYPYHLELPAGLQELIFDENCRYNQPLMLPAGLRKLAVSNCYDIPLPVNLPPKLLELELGDAYNHPLDLLPPGLKRLALSFYSLFNFPIDLPASLTSVELGQSYNQPTILPPGLQELEVGQAFAQDLTFPSSLRQIVWWCNHPIQIPEGVAGIIFGYHFNQPVMLPASLKGVSFPGVIYSHPLELPPGLEQLYWCPKEHADFVLPEGLQKLTWTSPRNVRLPSGLKELELKGDAALLTLPEGLLKVSFDDCKQRYALPESVQEVSAQLLGGGFTHPTTLQHLIITCPDSTVYFTIDLSGYKIHKMTIACRQVQTSQWPQGLKELAFTADGLGYPLRVPKGCRIVGDKRPANVITD